jgi:hypothetical protein
MRNKELWRSRVSIVWQNADRTSWTRMDYKWLLNLGFETVFIDSEAFDL